MGSEMCIRDRVSRPRMYLKRIWPVAKYICIWLYLQAPAPYFQSRARPPGCRVIESPQHHARDDAKRQAGFGKYQRSSGPSSLLPRYLLLLYSTSTLVYRQRDRSRLETPPSPSPAAVRDAGGGGRRESQREGGGRGRGGIEWRRASRRSSAEWRQPRQPALLRCCCSRRVAPRSRPHTSHALSSLPLASVDRPSAPQLRSAHMTRP